MEWMRYIYIYWPRKMSTHLKQKSRLWNNMHKRDVNTVGSVSENSDWPMWFSPHHMVPFPHYYSHSLLSQLPFFWVLIIFSLTHSLPQFPLFSPPAAPTLGTLGAIVCGSQTHALPRPGSGQVCPGVRESLIPEPPAHAPNPAAQPISSQVTLVLNLGSCRWVCWDHIQCRVFLFASLAVETLLQMVVLMIARLPAVAAPPP